MSKMSILDQCASELRNAAQSLLSAADGLAEMNAGNKTDPENDASLSEAQHEPEPKPITLEEVRAVLADQSVQGHTTAVQAMIHKRGVEKLSQVDPAEYASLLAEAEAL